MMHKIGGDIVNEGMKGKKCRQEKKVKVDLQSTTHSNPLSTQSLASPSKVATNAKRCLLSNLDISLKSYSF